MLFRSGKRGFDRFIPAGAGNTILRIKPPRDCTVYPRWRGEHGAGTPDDGVGIGLSPLAWGTRDINLRLNAQQRFIPAGAGNTRKNELDAAVASVYPRWRGEHAAKNISCCIAIGLSPLARGTLRRRVPTKVYMRFIPAGAGNTPNAKFFLAITSVYPRWRGEHSMKPSSRFRKSGLSPLARGTHATSQFKCAVCRFIPAGAGNTLKLYH